VARCVAPDLIGRGKSDKPDIEYRFLDHAKYLEGFIDKMGFTDNTLVVHDWGSALRFHFPMRHENKVKALASMEAIVLQVPSWEMFHRDHRPIFQCFRTPEVGWEMVVTKNMFVEKI
jgi:haloalkane dehalogenase